MGPSDSIVLVYVSFISEQSQFHSFDALPCDNVCCSEVVTKFNDNSSHRGALLLLEAEKRFGLLQRFCRRFMDRNPRLIEHTVEDLITQRVYGLALGFEGLNDHDVLQYELLFSTIVGKQGSTGQGRIKVPI